MEHYFKIIWDSYYGYANYLKNEFLYPSWHNYLYWLIGISLIVWLLEIIIPWRKKQPVFRKDFWLDGFYMFFNYFLFSLIAYNAISNIGVDLFNRFFGIFGITNLVAIEISSWPSWAQFLTMFLVADFIQWSTHVLLHRVPFLWEFHKVHHSVEQMGFAAHLRYHWMETIVYKTIQYIPLAMIGFGLKDFFILHIITVTIGHLNHSNLNITYGPLKYILNNPAMHIWHHAKEIPNKYGVNFGISLSLWDYLFKTAYLPKSGRDIELGFDNVDKFPKTFISQVVYPFKKQS
ncbi:MAG TPA: sterol desaturase family protein [Saprospiraceae bacterium]|nr:sterol desaturase family protein [Saprospiraceae bacterium]HNL29488.1 sterol desaturase family protein [Saprospiraceae bacterium]HNL95482.1 sterol desaturase family protein [Saprospiraceae bacterium]